MSLLTVEGLKVYYRLPGGLFRHPDYIKAVDDVSFEIEPGKVLGIVGESGCGKSTLARAIMGIVPLHSGKICLLDQDLASLSPKGLRDFRRHFQMVFQDPEASLNPRMTCGEIIGEPLKVYETSLTRMEVQVRVQALMDRVGLDPTYIRRFPHEFSGGQRQRISLARALSLRPQLLVCDEAVSALDVSVQAQILNLLKEIRDEYQLTYLFISHDLGVVRYICDDVMVMYLGRVAEVGPCREVIEQPRHPYTKALISAVPRYGRSDLPIELKGEIPSSSSLPSGCRFSTRCPQVLPMCRISEPSLLPSSRDGKVACFLSQG